MIFGWFLGFMYEWMLNHIKWLVLIYRKYLKYSNFTVQMSPSSVGSLLPYCRGVVHDNLTGSPLTESIKLSKEPASSFEFTTLLSSFIFNLQLPLPVSKFFQPNFIILVESVLMTVMLYNCLVLVTLNCSVLGDSGSCSFKLVL